jgi:hypothetical protein
MEWNGMEWNGMKKHEQMWNTAIYSVVYSGNETLPDNPVVIIPCLLYRAKQRIAATYR